ncbi:MAG: septal ring lytic transglycosylase RlpA family protein [Leptospirales bacterium]
MKRYLIIIFALYFAACASAQARPGKRNKADDKKNDSLETELFEGGESKNTRSKDGPAYVNIARGFSSWYGKELHGKPTASGELFDMYDFTAAHRTFPMGSIVLIRNLENGKKRLVRINDRGPYVEGRIIDVSYATARELGFAEKGVAHVEVELIEEGKDNFLSKADNVPEKTDSYENVNENSSSDMVDPDLVEGVDEDFDQIMKVNEPDYFFADGTAPKGYTVRVGAFKVRMNAEKFREDLEDKYGSRVFVGTKGKWHFVWVGDFSSKEDAKKFYEQLKTDGLDVMYPDKVQ